MTKLPKTTIQREVAGQRTTTFVSYSVPPQTRRRLPWRLMLCLLAMTTLIVSASVPAQTFQALPALSFTKMANSMANPLPQVLTVASTGTNFSFSASAVSLTGGDWLSVTPQNNLTTPRVLTIVAAPDAKLAAGTYSGHIVLKPSNSTISVAVPVSLTIAPSTSAFFDSLPGAITFSVTSAGTAPPAQVVPVRNGGSGTLAFTASTSTSDGGGWLTLSAPSGTAPSLLSVGLDPSKLPNGGHRVGAFTGQVLLQTGGDATTVPVTVTVGDTNANPVFRQVNPLNFTQAVSLTDTPVPQVVTLASTGAKIGFNVTYFNSTGGDWLSVTPQNNLNTPRVLTVTAAPANTLPAGTYTAEIVANSSDGTQASVVPVTLTIADPYSATFFDQLPGQLTFSMVTPGNPPPPQVLQVRNAGVGTLNFTASASTADGGNWLTLSATSGTAPSLVSVGLDPSKLPNGGHNLGTFTGQVTLLTNGDAMTIPVTVTVGDTNANPVFRQVNGLNFSTTAYPTTSPLPQVVTVASTGASIPSFNVKYYNSTGGNWLSVTPQNNLSTPRTLTVVAAPDTTLGPGTYSAEIVAQTSDGTISSTIPVTLTVTDPSATASFDQLPGQLTFSMVATKNAPPSQLLQIRNAGAGTLSFTALASTADGAGWLTLSATSGVAPSLVAVGIDPSKLPNLGRSPATYTGQVALLTNGNAITVPVTLTIGDTNANPVFEQVNGLNFTTSASPTKVPLPQVITLASTGASFGFDVKFYNSTGGEWLSVTPQNNLSTPRTLTVVAKPDTTLGPGTYSAEIAAQASDGTKSSTIPVTLTVADPSTSSFFDQLPGALTFSGPANGAAPASLPLPIRNAGQGNLAWTAKAITSDGGSWLNVSSTSGTAPFTPLVSITPANLPGAGQAAGTFTGQLLLQADGDITTVPVIVSLGEAVIKQPSPVAFSKTYQGANPPAQNVTLSSTGTAINFNVVYFNSTGGDWLTVTPQNNLSTPRVLTLTAAPQQTLGTGTYMAEVVGLTSDGTEAVVIPVTLYVGTSPTPPVATSSITVVSGANQSSPVGTAFSSPLVVLVKDANGAPIANATVTFSGTGLAFSSATVVTNSAGQASVTATPTLAGVLTVTASVAGGTPFVLFNETGVATATTTPPAFSSMAILPTGASASGISPIAVAGDFNGDGLQDLATANLVDASVSVLLGNGNGSFQAAATYGVGHGPYGLAAGDFNGDGKADLAVVNGLDNTVSVLLNKGAGGFPATPSFTYAVGGQPYGVSAADVNRDGVLDLIVTNNADKTVSVLLGNGDGSFRGQTTYATGSLPFGTAIADMNGDGYPDVIAWNYADNTVSVLLNDKTGRFAAQAVYATGSGPYGVSTGDFNGDGYPDVAVANLGGNTVSVLLNDKTGKLLPAVAYPVGSLPIAVLAADLNADGVLDLTVTNLGDGTISLLLGKGNGTFQPQTTADAGTQPYGVLAADFNGDSKLDLAVTSFFTPSIGVLLQNPSAASIKMKGAPPKKPVQLGPTR